MPADIKSIIAMKKGGKNTLPPEWQSLLTELFRKFLEDKGEKLLAEFEKKIKKAAEGLEPKLARELKAEIMAQMPTPQDGHTPSEEELLELIDRVMPAVKDGEDADPNEIAREVLDRIHKPKDGKTPSKKELTALLKPLVSAFEARFERKLNNALRTIGNASRGQQGGGGMGRPNHETFAIDSTTTSVTLVANVAAGGRAIWVYYQGQNLYYGTHYTVSGKTITLLFTPQNSTNLDVTYIRT